MKSYKEFIYESVKDKMTPKPVELIKQLITKHSDPAFVIMMGAEYGYLDLVKMSYKRLMKLKRKFDYYNYRQIIYDSLRQACFNGHLDIVKYLLEMIYDKFFVPYLRDGNDEILRKTCNKGYTDIVKILVKYGCDIHSVDEQCLRNAVYHDHIELTKFLLDNGADLHTWEDYCFRYAHSDEMKELLKSYLRTNESVRDKMIPKTEEEIDKNMESLLVKIAKKLQMRNRYGLKSAIGFEKYEDAYNFVLSNIDRVKKLVEEGCVEPFTIALNLTTSNESVRDLMTPISDKEVKDLLSSLGPDEQLKIAAGRGFIDIVKRAIENGANLNDYERVALKEAIREKHYDIIDLLMKSGLKLNKYDTIDEKIVNSVIKSNDIRLIKSIVKNITINEICLAIQENNTEILDYFLSKVEVNWEEQRWVLEWTVRHNNIEMLKYLFEKGMKTSGHWIVQAAIQTSDIDILKMVLKYGKFDKYTIDEAKNVARKSKRQDMLDLLRKYNCIE
jgi:ankyrin repeat protein